MELKKVWMSPETGKKSQYGYRAVGGILGIVFLMTVLLFTGTFLSLSFGLPQQSFSMILVLFATALSIAGGTYGISGNAGCHNFFSDRK